MPENRQDSGAQREHEKENRNRRRKPSAPAGGDKRLDGPNRPST